MSLRWTSAPVVDNLLDLCMCYAQLYLHLKKHLTLTSFGWRAKFSPQWQFCSLPFMIRWRNKVCTWRETSQLSWHNIQNSNRSFSSSISINSLDGMWKGQLVIQLFVGSVQKGRDFTIIIRVRFWGWNIGLNLEPTCRWPTCCL